MSRPAFIDAYPPFDAGQLVTEYGSPLFVFFPEVLLRIATLPVPLPSPRGWKGGGAGTGWRGH
jgi:hypothetical protein